MLTPRSRALIADTLPTVSAHLDQITRQFYTRLFAAHPDLESNLFNRGNQARGDQQRALAAALAQYARHQVDPESPSPSGMISRVSNKHASLGIVAEQYVVVHTHLFAAIASVLGEVVTAEVASAWNEVYWMLAHELITAETALYRDAGVDAGRVWQERLVIDRDDSVAEGTASFILAAADGEGALPPFEPGQYISIQMPLPDGSAQIRQYSLSNAWRGDGLWRITVRGIAPTRGSHAAYVSGSVSNQILATVSPGDTLYTSLPFGTFTIPEGDGPLLLISAGSGVTPFVGMLTHLADAGSTRTITVVHTDRTAERHAHRVEAESAIAALPGALGDVWYTMERDRATRHLVIGPEHIEEGTTAYVCGPIPFMAHIRTQLLALGLAPEAIRTEVFGPERDLSVPASPRRGRRARPEGATDQAPQ